MKNYWSQTELSLAALQQIKDKGYADSYMGSGKMIHLVGVNFDSATRSIAGWQEEMIQSRDLPQ